jgi:polysaccharide pyruvyl transferase WcaK-like protein
MGDGVDLPTFRVGVSGSYGGFNLGDEAILHVIVSELRRSVPVEITVFSRDAEDTRRRHDVDHVYGPKELSRREAQVIIAGLDLFILGGGGILYDADDDMYLREVLVAHETGTPVMVYAISAGPLADAPLRARVRDALNRAVAITVRDRHSRQLLEEIGIERDVILTADPVPRAFPAGPLCQRHHPRELTAERLLAGAAGGRTR